MFIPDKLLKNKKILIGVTGSIAIYKSLELIRMFTKAGADVRVVMSPSASEFVTPLTFEALSGNAVLEQKNQSWSTDLNHIQLTKWADLFIIAPATANTIAKLANAIADNLLLECALAYSGKKVLAPSANTNMLDHPITKANLKMLAIANYVIVDPQEKELACKTVGNGAMAEPLDVFFTAAKELLHEPFWQDRRVIVTGGGTIEKIDDVRYISNFSSGKMASALAIALYCKGADVNLIATQFPGDLPTDMHKIQVTSSAEMLEFLIDSIRIAKKGKLSKPSLIEDEPIALIQKTPYLFMAAAVSDYIPKFPQSGKLKKEHLGSSFTLQLEENTDMLKTIDKQDIKTVAFKAEMQRENAKTKAKELLIAKNIDAVCLNILKDSQSFGDNYNEIEFITEKMDIKLNKTDKISLAFNILDYAKEL